MMIKRAIISVYDKSGLDNLVKVLDEFNFQIISSGGTARRIREIGFSKLTEVSEYTGYPESPGGLVKTLHPKIHGGILLNRDNLNHRRWMHDNGVQPIDLVVVNLYPFEKVVAEGADLITAVNNIDIGGPTMIRSTAKACILYDKTCIVTDPSQYNEIIKTLRENAGEFTTELRKEYALDAFKRTKEYEAAIVEYLEEKL